MREVNRIQWPEKTFGSWHMVCTANSETRSRPKEHRRFAFVSITPRLFARKDGLVRKWTWGSSHYDVIAPWPDLTWSKKKLPKGAQRMSHWLCKTSSRSAELFGIYREKPSGGGVAPTPPPSTGEGKPYYWWGGKSAWDKENHEVFLISALND